MKVGVFIDIDGVCTWKAAQLQYAKLLGVEKEQSVLERDFKCNKLHTEEFGRQLVRLFRDRLFTREKAKQYFSEIVLKDYAKPLLELFREDIYIVSSAPSYFIESLADQYDIPKERCLYSEYEFDDKGLIAGCKTPVSSSMKHDFVNDHRGQCDITVGIGDTPEQDSAFMGVCDFSIFVGRGVKGYLMVQDIDLVRSFLGHLKKLAEHLEIEEIDKKKFAEPMRSAQKLLDESPYDRNVFIMTPFKDDDRYKNVIKIIRQALKERNYKGWLASDKRLDDQLWDNVQSFMLACKYGIAIFTREGVPDDAAADETTSQFNPNVSMELGFMLSRGKDVLILKDKAVRKLHTDIIGSLYDEFDLNEPEESLVNIVEDWIDQKGT